MMPPMNSTPEERPDAAQIPVRARHTWPLLYVLLTPLVPICIRFLSRHMDSSTMIFVRLGSGTIVLFMICVLMYPHDLRALLRTRSHLLLLIGAAVFGLIGQYGAVEGLALTSAAVGGIIRVIGIPLTIILAAVVFHDERRIATNRYFAAGAAVAAVGTVGVALCASDSAPSYSTGVLWLLLATTIGAVRHIAMKKLVLRINPIVVAMGDCLIATCVFGTISLHSGQMRKFFFLAPHVILIAVLSGVGGLLVGAALHLVLVKRIGISALTILGLVIPVWTAALAFVLIGDILSPAQCVFGLVVISGCFLSFSARRGPSKRQ